MSDSIILKNNPKIEFQLRDEEFQLIDERTKLNSGYYSFEDLQRIELNKPWFPRLASWLRVITWIFNDVLYFPDAETCKKSNVIFHFRKGSLDCG